MSFPNVVDVIGGVTSKIQTLGVPYYYCGHVAEVINTLAAKDQNKEWKLKKYPAVFLFHTFKEERTEYESTVNDLRIAFVTNTRQNWKAANRYENIFDPVLTPIMENFIHELSRYDGIEWGGEYECKYYPFWGSENDKNVGNDFADAIEITLKDLKIFPTCSGTPDLPPVVVSAFTSMTGEFIYLVLSRPMASPVGLHEGINVGINETEIVPFSIWRSNENLSLYVVDLAPNAVQYGDIVTISLPGNTFVTEDNAELFLPEYINLTVANNVLSM